MLAAAASAAAAPAALAPATDVGPPAEAPLAACSAHNMRLLLLTRSEMQQVEPVERLLLLQGG